MKKIITICAAILMTASVFAQAPDKMSYQAVIRNSSNALIVSTTLGMQISILLGSSSGTAVYEETQTPTSNTNGLVSLEIGEGTVVSGDFTTIDWANGPYFIKTETDPTGGTNYAIIGTSQLLSVPYALHAKTAETLMGGGGLPPLTIGQSYQGGKIFWLDDTGRHGLIAAESDQVYEHGIQWFDEYSNWTIYTGTTGDGLYAGAMNTTIIVALQMAQMPDYRWSTIAAKLCADYSFTASGVTYGDWYLPSKYELNLLFEKRNEVGGFVGGAFYWSSTESNKNEAWFQDFSTGDQSSFTKVFPGFVRAIRAF